MTRRALALVLLLELGACGGAQKADRPSTADRIGDVLQVVGERAALGALELLFVWLQHKADPSEPSDP